jgi:putative tryptophan/tyrosine transport system substrate-binding protein
MRRREFITALGGAAVTSAWPIAARAQQPRKIPRIGVLWHAGSAEEEGPYFKGLIEGLTNLGYIDGRNVIMEHRFPNETPALFRSMASELVSSKVDILIGVGSQTAPYVKSATTTIPIIFVFSPDPVGTKLVSSLAQPGGNATGLTNFAADLIGKRLQYLKDTVPELSRVALLVNPATQVARLYIDVTQAAAAKLNLINYVFEAKAHNELEQTFDRMTQSGMQAVTINSEGLAFQHKEFIAKLAIARRLPLSVWSRETLQAGALMSYGPDQVAICRRAAVFVDKILRGAHPAELPVEEPTKIEFLINLKTAKALGLTVPPKLLYTADEVIE